MKEMIMLLNKQITINNGLICHFEICKNYLLKIKDEERDLYFSEKKDLEFYNKSINDLLYENNLYLSIVKILKKIID